jgi:hypothetical protein
MEDEWNDDGIYPLVIKPWFDGKSPNEVEGLMGTS